MALPFPLALVIRLGDFFADEDFAIFGDDSGEEGKANDFRIVQAFSQ